jgi:hypothetical protein
MYKINSSIADAGIFNKTMQLFDEVNAKDPNLELSEGQEVPKELLYSQRMTDCLLDYDAEANEALQLAVRAQHIQRWEKPRSDYPEGKLGYLKWRKELYAYHGDLAAGLMSEAGYGEDIQERLKTLLLKTKIKSDEGAQALEDVACLVFLGSYFDDFVEKHSEEKLIVIVQKTWNKMSEHGHAMALKINYSETAKKIIDLALAD